MELYHLNIRRLHLLPEEATEGISSVRRRKMEKYRNRDDRLRSLAAAILLRWRCGDGELLADTYGKPYLSAGPHFNLSHSGDLAVLAMGDGPVGVDVEEHRDGDLSSLVRAAFHPAERGHGRGTLRLRNFTTCGASRKVTPK
ncbi:MAG: hypothetical protein LIP18_02625 [Planctomycetes bacterium]|nr:hypothetical protein [Planctomycetota bacterium]